MSGYLFVFLLAKGRVFWLKLRAGCDWKTETISTSLGQIKGSSHSFNPLMTWSIYNIPQICIGMYMHIEIYIFKYIYIHSFWHILFIYTLRGKNNPNVHAPFFFLVYQHLYLHNQPKVAERWFRIEWDTIIQLVGLRIPEHKLSTQNDGQYVHCSENKEWWSMMKRWFTLYTSWFYKRKQAFLIFLARSYVELGIFGKLNIRKTFHLWRW